MNNKALIILLTSCLFLTGLCLYQFNVIRAFKTSQLTDKTTYDDKIKDISPNNQGISQDILKYQNENDQLKEKIVSLQRKLKQQSLLTKSALIKPNAENLKVDQAALQLGSERIKTAKKNIQNQYAVMFGELRLSEEDQESLNKLLLESKLLQSASFDDEKFNEQFEKLENIDKKITDLLNNPDSSELYKKFQQSGESAFYSINNLDETLSRDDLTKLTPEQKRQLTLSEVKSYNEPDYKKVYNGEYLEKQENMSIDERVDYEVKLQKEVSLLFNQNQKEIEKKRLEQAQNILTQEQYEKYKMINSSHLNDFIEEGITQSRAAIRKRIEEQETQFN